MFKKYFLFGVSAWFFLTLAGGIFANAKTKFSAAQWWDAIKTKSTREKDRYAGVFQDISVTQDIDQKNAKLDFIRQNAPDVFFHFFTSEQNKELADKLCTDSNVLRTATPAGADYATSLTDALIQKKSINSTQEAEQKLLYGTSNKAPTNCYTTAFNEVAKTGMSSCQYQAEGGAPTPRSLKGCSQKFCIAYVQCTSLGLAEPLSAFCEANPDGSCPIADECALDDRYKMEANAKFIGPTGRSSEIKIKRAE